MRNLKYFIPIIGSLLKNNPYQTRFSKPKMREILYDIYQILMASLMLVCCMIIIL